MGERPPASDDELRRRERERLVAHRGLATLGERLVPLEEFRRRAAAHGRRLDAPGRTRAAETYLAAGVDPTPVEGPFRRIAVFGGVYSNHLALAALLDDAARRGVDAIYCLGDLGAFGPHPDRVFPLLDAGAVRTIQGNYEESLSSGAEDCNCGYADPRDNHFAEISYRYTAENTSESWKRWMGELPRRRRVLVGVDGRSRELLLVHGSPRRINEFLFRSTSPVGYLEVLCDQERCDGILFTHTGLHWHRRLPSGRDAVNVGVIGRPANDGRTNVWFALVGLDETGALEVETVPLPYDHERLAGEMRDEGLPEEFVETVRTGWWTTCLEVLPARERRLSRF